MLQDVEFERRENGKEVTYVACFKSNKSNKRKLYENALQLKFKANVLHDFKLALSKCQDPSLHDVENPSYVNAGSDDPSSEPYLSFSISEAQYIFYCENKQIFRLAQRCKIYYAFFHQYSISENESVYVQQLPDDEPDETINIVTYFRNIIKGYPGIFEKYFSDRYSELMFESESESESDSDSMSKSMEGYFSYVNGKHGRFITARFIKTAVDYENWIKFINEWHGKAMEQLKSKAKDKLDRLPLDFFSNQDNIKDLQRKVDQVFLSERIPIEHLVCPSSECFKIVDDFSWSERSGRYQFLWLSKKGGLTPEKKKANFYLFLHRLRSELKQHGIYGYAAPGILGFNYYIFLSKKSWEVYKKAADSLLLSRLREPLVVVTRLPFSPHSFLGKQVYISITRDSLVTKPLKRKLKENRMLHFKYRMQSVIVLTEYVYSVVSKSDWYSHPSPEIAAINAKKIADATADPGFFIPLDVKVEKYLGDLKKYQPDDSGQLLLDFFNTLGIVNFNNNLVRRVVGFLIENKLIKAGGFESDFLITINYLGALINRHLKNVTRAMSAVRYYECLTALFKEHFPEKDNNMFPFFIDYDRDKIVYRLDGILDQMITVFLKSGRYRLEYKSSFFEKAPPQKHIAMRLQLLCQLLRLFIAVIHTNAMIYLQRREDMPNEFINLTEELPSYAYSEQYQLLFNAMNGDVKSSDETIKLAKNYQAIQEAITRFRDHFVIANTHECDIGEELFLMAGAESLVIKKDDIITYLGQSLVVDAMTVKPLIEKGVLSTADVGNYSQSAVSRGALVNVIMRDQLSGDGPGHYINHTSDPREQNVVLKFAESREGLSCGAYFQATKDFVVLPYQAYRLLTSYGKDKRRLENVHRIPAEGGVLSSVAVSIDQLVGIKWINPSLEKEAVAYALERHPKRGASVGAAPAAAAPPMPLKKRLLAARAAPPATRALPMHALPVSFFGSAPASVIAQREKRLASGEPGEGDAVHRDKMDKCGDAEPVSRRMTLAEYMESYAAKVNGGLVDDDKMSDISDTPLSPAEGVDGDAMSDISDTPFLPF